MKETKVLLETEVQREIEQLKKMEVCDESYKDAVDGITKLTDRLIEIEKVQNEVSDKEIKLKEMEDERKDRLIKNCLTGASIVTGIGLTVWGTIKSLKFEEEGTVTTIVGRGFINKLLPKK